MDGHRRHDLCSLTLAGNETITAEAGYSLEIYLDLDDSFDVSSGTKVSPLKAGTYAHVVILVK